jgi:hypothetical protein
VRSAKEYILNLVRALAALALAGPLFAQYGGPAILARGQSPAAMDATQIDFRPYVSVTGSYTAGLNGVSVDANGAPVDDASFGVTVGYGVSGFHSWKHTKLGLNYSGGFSHYAKSFYDGISSQSLQLSLTHQLSRHAVLSLSSSAVYYGSNRSSPSLPSTLEFDPATTYLPTNDFFDNRTIALSTQASVVIQKSTRLSYSLGGDAFLTRRWSTALYGTKGIGAHGDIQYRTGKRTTIGVMYSYMHYGFTGIYGNTDSHTVGGTYSVTLSRSMQFSATAGLSRYENVFVEIVPIDPAIAAVIGISSAQRVTYMANVTPNINARLSKVVPRGAIFVSGSHGINPGNGLFLTSTSTNVGGGYSYTGLRRWALAAGANYDNSTSQGNVLGQYGSYSGTLSASRQIARATHGVLSFDLRKYDSGDFQNYNKWSYSVNLGLSFSPGDIPVRFW